VPPRTSRLTTAATTLQMRPTSLPRMTAMLVSRRKSTRGLPARLEMAVGMQGKTAAKMLDVSVWCRDGCAQHDLGERAP
jgi:hypothetical protein